MVSFQYIHELTSLNQIGAQCRIYFENSISYKYIYLYPSFCFYRKKIIFDKEGILKPNMWSNINIFIEVLFALPIISPSKQLK